MMASSLGGIEKAPSGFPESPRVIYSVNPLINVTCQLRFPAILRIETERPASFQERIREQYPLFQETTTSAGLELPAEMPPGMAKLLRGALQRQAGVAYNFVSADNKWTVGLKRDSLALTANHYERWEQFRSHLEGPLQALTEIYKPAFYERIGLRYQDLIERSKLGLLGTEWSHLLQSHIAGVLAEPAVSGLISGVISVMEIRLAGDLGKVKIQHGLAENALSKEECYLIDSDFFSDERTETAYAIDRLNSFNRQSGRLFRWCITAELHRVMGPQPIL